MSILSDIDILERMYHEDDDYRIEILPTPDFIKEGKKRITPNFDKVLQPASYEVTLDPKILHFNSNVNVHPTPVDQPLRSFEFNMDNADSKYTLRPGEFILASTAEYLKNPVDILCRLEGKSSRARNGLAIHVTAGFIDPGFHGKITLEVVNFSNTPLTLRPGISIGQLSFHQMGSTPKRPYGHDGLNSHYHGQDEVTSARK